VAVGLLVEEEEEEEEGEVVYRGEREGLL